MQIAVRLSDRVEDLEFLAREELDTHPTAGDEGLRRPPLMTADQLHEAVRRLRLASTTVLVEAGGWGQVIDELHDACSREIEDVRDRMRHGDES
ncbi:MAG TPA: hypothetical protein VEK80_07785 [Kribbellaceae bacterium]|nr:hypothetical protein [Kribbellaceae bacterium]